MNGKVSVERLQNPVSWRGDRPASNLDDGMDRYPGRLRDCGPLFAPRILQRLHYEAMKVIHMESEDKPKTVPESRDKNPKWFEAAAIMGSMGKARPISEIVAENVARLISYDRRTGESKIPQSFLTKKGVAQATIGRILRAEVSPRCETVAIIARYFDLQPWQLLVEGLDPAAPPLLRVPTGREAEFYRRVQQLAKEMGIEEE